MSVCLITGCGLQVGFEQVWGDLHKEGDCYIFNAVLNREGEANLRATPENPMTSTRNILVLQDGAPYFERRGVFVVHRTWAVLNPAAKEYLK